MTLRFSSIPEYLASGLHTAAIIKSRQDC